MAPRKGRYKLKFLHHVWGRDRRVVAASFEGGDVSSDGGVLLLRQLERRLGLLTQVSSVLSDPRDPERITHSLTSMLKQRVYGLALGWEDLNDHAALRQDVAMQTAVDRDEVASRPRCAGWRAGPTGPPRRACTRCWSSSSSPASRPRPRNWCWTSTPPTTRCTASRRALLPRLLRQLLLPAAVRVLRPATAVRLPAAQPHRRGAAHRGDPEAAGAPAAPGLARGAHHLARRLGLLPPARDQLVRALGVHYIIGLARNPRLEAQVEYAQLALKDEYEQHRPQAAAHRRVQLRRAELGARAARDHAAGVGRAGPQPALHGDEPGGDAGRCTTICTASVARPRTASRRRRSGCLPPAPVATLRGQPAAHAAGRAGLCAHRAAARVGAAGHGAGAPGHYAAHQAAEGGRGGHAQHAAHPRPAVLGLPLSVESSRTHCASSTPLDPLRVLSPARRQTMGLRGQCPQNSAHCSILRQHRQPRAQNQPVRRYTARALTTRETSGLGRTAPPLRCADPRRAAGARMTAPRTG